MEVYNTSSNRLYHLVITESIVKHFALHMASFAISFLNFSFSISKLMHYRESVQAVWRLRRIHEGRAGGKSGDRV